MNKAQLAKKRANLEWFFKNIQCGIHSGFPFCCALWWSCCWAVYWWGGWTPILPMTATTRLVLWLKHAALESDNTDCGYARCPFCRLIGRVVDGDPVSCFCSVYPIIHWIKEPLVKEKPCITACDMGFPYPDVVSTDLRLHYDHDIKRVTCAGCMDEIKKKT
jgi:hypothetical protein